MATWITAGDRMNDALVVLENGLGVVRAIARLEEASSPLAVVVGTNGSPEGLLTAEDLSRALNKAGSGEDALSLAEARRWLPPLLTVPAAITLHELVEADQFTFIQQGARGVVVTEDGRVVGVLTRAVIARYLAEEHSPEDTWRRQLTGEPMTPTGVVACAHPKCGGTVNELEFLDPDNLPWCRNALEPEPGRHRLVPGWL